MAINPIRTVGEGGIQPPTVFCPLLKKYLDDSYLKFRDFSQLLVSDTHMIFFSKNLIYTSDNTFGTPSTIFFLFFALIKKISLLTLVEIIFRYHKKTFLDFWDPLGPPYNQKEKKVNISHMECWVESIPKLPPRSLRYRKKRGPEGGGEH